VKPDFNELQKGLGDIGRALASKDLREPANIEALLDIILWIAVVLLAFIFSIRDWGSSFSMFCMAFWFTVASFVWLIIHYTVRRTIHRR